MTPNDTLNNTFYSMIPKNTQKTLNATFYSMTPFTQWYLKTPNDTQ
jgi:hypothetical protein